MKQYKILVVDDEDYIVELVKFNLEKEGYQVIVANDGRSALDMVHAEHPDLILLDIMLPNVDGLEVCRILKQSTTTNSIPIIMLTAKGDEIDTVLGLEMGADDYIKKPFSPLFMILAPNIY
jgi:two-component system alkaline phosphatase synthesis response regulator PhoP